MGSPAEGYEARVAGGLTARQLAFAAAGVALSVGLTWALGAAGLPSGWAGIVCMAASTPFWLFAFGERAFGMPAGRYLRLWWRQNGTGQHLAYSCRARLEAAGNLVPAHAAPSATERELLRLRAGELWRPSQEEAGDGQV